MPNFGGEGCKLFVYGVSTGTPKVSQDIGYWI